MKPRLGFAALTGLMLAVAACGSGSGQAGTTLPASSVPETAAAQPGPAAPDVVLQLDDGSTFSSANASRPILYVFWAEW